MKSQRLGLSVAVCFLTAAPIFAHDTWLIPAKFRINQGETISFDLTSGMAFPAFDVGPKRERIEAIMCRIADRTFALKDFVEASNSLRIKAEFFDPGVAVIWVKSPPKEIELKPDQVKEYLDEIDAPAAVRQRWAGMKEPKRWRESYRKHSKTFVEVGDGKVDNSWREPVGMFLEIVPEKDPTTRKAGDDLPVCVLRDGKPFSDFSLGIMAEGETQGIIKKTDAAGKVSFRLEKGGRYLLRGTDLRKSTKPEVDWESDFTTLTVEVEK